MPSLDPAFAAHLGEGVTHLCRCWKVARRDGVVLGFTDHDGDLAFSGTVFAARTGLDAAEAERELGFAEPPPPYAPDWSMASRRDLLLEAAGRWFPATDGVIAPGRVILFRWREGLPAAHCAIAASADAMIHAHDAAEVAEVALAPSWRRRIAAVHRFPERVRP
jgi:NlpC/P60 family putative phage cell wall peptidase